MTRLFLSLIFAASLTVGCSQSDPGVSDTPSASEVSEPFVPTRTAATEKTEPAPMDTAETNLSPTDTPETVDTASIDTPRQSDADAPGAADTLSPNEVTLIAWEDLMPEGEEERLTELYEEFYREFEERLMQQQSTLMSSGEDNQDLSLSLISEGSDMDTMEQIGTFNVVDDLDGMKIRLPGYIVPLDFSADAEHREFLLVPYFGACLHTPPPPPNQIVFVSAEPPAKIPNIYDPVWLEGTLTTGRFDTDMGNSAYELSLSKLEPYEF